MPRTILALLALLACEPAVSAPGATTPAASPAPLRYIAIGASDTVGEGASDPATRSWPALLAGRLPAGSTYLNVGVSGSTVERALAEQLPRVRGQRADLITVWLAVNDLNASVGPQVFGQQLAALLAALEHTGARVFVGTVPDLTLVPAYAEVDRQLLASAVAANGQAIAAAVAAHAGFAVLVDLHTGSDVIASEAVVATDGFHPSDRGYELIAARFADVIRAHGLPLSSPQ